MVTLADLMGYPGCSVKRTANKSVWRAPAVNAITPSENDCVVFVWDLHRGSDYHYLVVKPAEMRQALVHLSQAVFYSLSALPAHVNNSEMAGVIGPEGGTAGRQTEMGSLRVIASRCDIQAKALLP